LTVNSTSARSDPAFQEALRRALSSQVFANWPWLVVLSALAPALQAVVLTPIADRVWLLTWLAFCAASVGFGVAVVWRRRRTPTRDLARLTPWLAVAAMLHGLEAGVAVPLFTDAAHPMTLALLPATLCALGGIAVVALHAYPPAMWAMLVGALAPVWIWAQVQPDSAPLARYTVPFIMMVLVAWGWRAHVGLRELVTLRLENRRLRKQSERRRRIAEAASQSKSRFLATASHDLRQPVNGLLLQTEALQIKTASAPELADLAGRVHRTAQAVNRLLDGLLDISRLDVANIKSPKASVDLTACLHELTEEYRPRVEAKGLRLQFHVPAQARLQSDAIGLQRLLRNLLENALNYTRRGGILLAARRRGDHWLIQVWDSGIGIDSAETSLVFDELYRSVDRVGPASGLGLGLAVARRLAAQLGGTLDVHSRHGRGSVFSLRLPSSCRADARLRVSETPAKLLLVEPDSAVRETLEACLQAWDYPVIASASFAEALHRAVAEPRAPLALICSMESSIDGTEGIDGLEAAERLRDEFNAAIPTLLTARDLSPSSLERIRAGECLYLPKPIAPEALRRCVESMLQTAASAASGG
jgi:signal transduction histidine kinase/ActR/RegA family two-component response regulator